MPTIKYPNNPNTDTVFVTDDNNHRTRAVKTAQVDGTIDYPTNPNSDSCYVTVDGKKQRALMVADISSEGTLDYPKNSNSTKGYVTVNGKKQRVTLTASLVGGGTTPTGTLNITSNGTHDVTNYASADVQVPTNVSEPYVNWTINASGELVSSGSHITNFTGVQVINRSFGYAYQNNKDITGTVDMSDVVQIFASCQNMFDGCSNITKVNLSSLNYISGAAYCQYMFQHTGVTEADLSSLKNLSTMNCCNQMFYQCSNLTTILFDPETVTATSCCADMFTSTGLTSVRLKSLNQASGNTCLQYMFSNCVNLTDAHFDSLSLINNQRVLSNAFRDCPVLTNIYFYALNQSSFGTYTNQFNGMLNYNTGVTVHFPIAVQSKIGSWGDVTSGFGGTSTTVLFDIVTTLTGADSNSYTRKQKESTSSATAWEYNSTTYYTSGTTEPAVNATIYSDAACTTAVTTVSAIA